MNPANKLICLKRRGTALIISMIFVLVFSALAVSMASLSGVNLQIADNQHKVNSALSAAESALECGKYIVANTPLPSTSINIVTTTQADQVWSLLCDHVQAQPWVDEQATLTSNEITTPAVNFGAADASFQVRFYRDGPCSIRLEGIGNDGQVQRQVSIEMTITKDNEVLNYAVASKNRVWITGNSTIHGNIYSSWKYQNISPFNMTSDSTVEGTINTILTKNGPDLYAGTVKMPYHLETLDDDGNPVYDASGNKVISPTDEIQGQYQSINYGVDYGDKATNMPGMKVSDYNTSQYKAQTTTIPSSYYNTTTVTEYFPHAAGNYSLPGPSGGLKLTRYVCENKTLTNAQVVVKKNALFKNCTFNGILYVDGGSTTNYNDVRFENCVFNGPIVTTPSTDTSSGWWQRNQLYFTGEETFQNDTNVPATILAPNFNVNLGNTNPNSGEDNVLTGAIVGGIVDVRGNAEIFGTIISMFDTSMYSSGYVSNIGATLDDGGSETTEPGDIGIINITPDPDKMLPSGITTPIIIKPLQETYSEGI